MVLDASLPAGGHLASCLVVGPNRNVVAAHTLAPSVTIVARLSSRRDYVKHIDVVWNARKIRICRLGHLLVYRRLARVEVTIEVYGHFSVLVNIKTVQTRGEDELVAPIGLWLKTLRKKSSG